MEAVMDTPIAQGLSQAEASRRLAEFGPNELKQEKPPSQWLLLLSQFKSPLVFVLIGASLISGFLGQWVDSAAIGTVVILNSLVGFIQEFHAENAIAALRKLTSVSARVIRDGKLMVLPAAQVVPGDVLVLEAGDVVAADAVLKEADQLRTNEAALTGESMPNEKALEPAADTAPLAEQQNRIFMGTSVAAGTGKACVDATGMKTQIGKIADLVTAAQGSATPLQRGMAALGHQLIFLCLGVVGLTALLGHLRGQGPLELLISSISLAVAGVPEGLPAVVTIALAIGIQRMAARKVLVRRLSAVETLGCTTVICTDKTGTLTTGTMVVRQLWGADQNRVLQVASACVDAQLNADGKDVGDPTELAILRDSRARGLERAALETEDPRVRTIPFDASRKWMAVLRGDNRLYVKGAPEVMVPLCSRGAAEGLSAATAMAAQGLRVLAVAVGQGDSAANLELVGLIGIADPPRPEVAEAVARARRAGITTVMITGDHPATAEAIAKELGILVDGENADGKVHARATPEDKLQIIRRWKAKGAVVAMTGDGVNDAPALREADIGIAMGQAGTEVTKEAADVILADDNFASIVEGVREGRGIYENIRKSLVYLLTGNFGELLFMLAGSLMGLPLPLLPLQILWINLVTDGLPALALVTDPAPEDALDRQPRGAQEPMLGRRQWMAICLTGALEASVAMAVFLWALRYRDLGEARTLAFSVIVFTELFRSFASRSETKPYWQTKILSNVNLIAVVLGSVVMQIAIHHFEWTRRLFGISKLDLTDYVISIGLGLIVYSVLESRKLLKGANGAASSPDPAAARTKKISEAAFALAKKRGFEPGHELEDWAQAEKTLDGVAAKKKKFWG